MFSKILIKLIDQAIVPALLLLATRIVSVVLVSRYFGIDYNIAESGFVFSSANDYVLINTYSTFFMLAVLTIGLLYILLKAYIFHETHITPKVAAKLFSLRLSSFIQASFDLYSQGAIWLSYTFFLTLISGILGMFGLIQSWVFFTGLVLNIISTVLFVFDVVKEMELKKSTFAEFDTDSEFLEEKNEAYS